MICCCFDRGKVMAKYSIKAPTVIMKKKPANNQPGPQATSQTRSGIPTIAVVIRALRLAFTGRHRGFGEFVELLVGTAEAAPPPLVFEQSLQVLLLAKFRP